MTLLLYATALGTALVAGVFFAFSSFVMQALGRLPSSAGIAAMQSINIVVINPWFFLPFFGAGLLCVVATAVSLLDVSSVAPTPVFAGSALYLFGCLLVTGARNVPLNDRLAKVDPHDEKAALLWRAYLTRWTRWNHVRTAASLAAAAAFAVAASPQ